MWGGLWEVPFNAAIWGTVAAWFGVLGTVTSVGTAAFYYVRNLKREERAQARHVTFVSDHWTASKYLAEVHNFSDASIFDVTPVQERKFTFREVLADEYCQRGTPTADRVRELRSEWEKTSGGTLYVQSLESGHIRPGDSMKVEFAGARTFAQRYSVRFRDAMARTWELELDGRDPQPFEDDYNPGRPFSTIEAFRHPRAYLECRKQERLQDRWLDRNLKQYEGRG